MDKEEFLQKYNDYYRSFAKENSLKVKMIRIRQGLQFADFDFDKIYESVTSQNWFGKFPDWDCIKEIVFRHKKIPAKYRNEPGKVHGVNGVWKCKDCHGKGGYSETKERDGFEYVFFKQCRVCECEGIAIDNNYFEYFLTPEQIEALPEWQAIRRIIGVK